MKKRPLWKPINSFRRMRLSGLRGVIMMRARPEPLLLIHEPDDPHRFRDDFFRGRWKILLEAREFVLVREHSLLTLLREHYRLYGLIPIGNYAVIEAVYY